MSAAATGTCAMPPAAMVPADDLSARVATLEGQVTILLEVIRIGPRPTTDAEALEEARCVGYLEGVEAGAAMAMRAAEKRRKPRSGVSRAHLRPIAGGQR